MEQRRIGLVAGFALVILGLLVIASGLPPAGAAPAPQATATTPFPTRHARLPQAPYPGIWHFLDLDLEAPNLPEIVGTHRVWGWDELQPAPGVFNWHWVEAWVSAAANQGKPVALGVNTYDGYYDGGDHTPQWVYADAPDARVVCPDGWTIPKYWDDRWLAAFEDFVAAFAARYDGDPRVAWVEISTGVYGETAPVSSNFGYVNCMLSAGLTPDLWVTTVKRIVDIYTAHFRETPLFLQMAPAFLKWWERREFSNYAAAKGVGLKHNGLQVDMGTAEFGPCPDAGSQCESGFVELMRRWGDQVPIAWEGDPRVLPPTNPLDPAHPEWAIYWQILNALDKHSDYILYNHTLAQNARLTELFRWANSYLGRTVYDTPSVWVALRETRLAPVRNPQRGNYSFWLWQNDAAPAGRSVPVWDVGPPPEGYYARRTDGATGNSYLYFNVADAYIYNGNVRGATVRVTYLDQGTDTWALEYDSQTDPYKRAGVVRKQNTGTWQVATFTLDDVRFANRQPGGGAHPGSDFRISNMGDGDEIIHFVEVIRTPVATATPTPTRPVRPLVTPTPTPGRPLYRVKLQEGRNGYTGTEDTTLDRSRPTVNLGNEPTLALRALPAGQAKHILVRFELNHIIPANAQVEYAWLALNTTSATGPDVYARGYTLLRPWSEQGATWQQAAPGSPWGTGGANGANYDRDARWYGQGWAHKQGEWIRVDVTEALRGWLRDPQRNFGVVLVPFSYASYGYEFASSEYPDPTRRPMLIVAYTLPNDPIVTPTPVTPPTPTPTPTPTITPSPTPTPTPTPAHWIVMGTLYDAHYGRDAVIAGGAITVTLGTQGPQIATRSNESGHFVIVAYAPDDGPLTYEVSAAGYHPYTGEEPPRTPRQYTLFIGLEPLAPPRAYLPWVEAP